MKLQMYFHTLSLACKTFVSVSTSPWKPQAPRTVDPVLKIKKNEIKYTSCMQTEKGKN
jgi:hypothetical protein